MGRRNRMYSLFCIKLLILDMALDKILPSQLYRYKHDFFLMISPFLDVTEKQFYNLVVILIAIILATESIFVMLTENGQQHLQIGI